MSNVSLLLISHHVVSLSLLDLPAPLVTIPGSTIGTVGEDLALICSVRVADHLIAKAIMHVEWSGGSLGSRNGVMEHIIHNGSYISNTLIFNPLLLSHGARYTCQAEIYISSINLLKMASDKRNVFVQSKLSNTNTFWKYMNLMCTYITFHYNFKKIRLMHFFTLQFLSLM